MSGSTVWSIVGIAGGGDAGGVIVRLESTIVMGSTQHRGLGAEITVLGHDYPDTPRSISVVFRGGRSARDRHYAIAEAHRLVAQLHDTVGDMIEDEPLDLAGIGIVDFQGPNARIGVACEGASAATAVGVYFGDHVVNVLTMPVEALLGSLE